MNNDHKAGIIKPVIPVVDAHCDTISAYLSGERDLVKGSTDGHLDLPRLRQGGVTVQFLASFIETEYKPKLSVIRGLELVEGCRRLIAANPEYLLLLDSYADIEKAMNSKRTAALLSVEGGEILGGKLFMVSMLYRLGVRSLCLTWNHANEIAGGVSEPGGLTKFGVDVIREMNRLGMLVDVSHLSDKGFWDVLQVSQDPVIASHSCCRSLCDHPRNLTDEQIKALAQKGGVIGINFYSKFLTGGQAGLNDVVRHIDHICSLVGSDHVGLGSDFDGCGSLPVGLEDVSRLPALGQALLDKGYSREEMEKIMGGNFLRVIRKVIG